MKRWCGVLAGALLLMIVALFARPAAAKEVTAFGPAITAVQSPVVASLMSTATAPVLQVEATPYMTDWTNTQLMPFRQRVGVGRLSASPTKGIANDERLPGPAAFSVSGVTGGYNLRR